MNKIQCVQQFLYASHEMTAFLTNWLPRWQLGWPASWLGLTAVTAQWCHTLSTSRQRARSQSAKPATKVDVEHALKQFVHEKRHSKLWRRATHACYTTHMAWRRTYCTANALYRNQCTNTYIANNSMCPPLVNESGSTDRVLVFFAARRRCYYKKDCITRTRVIQWLANYNKPDKECSPHTHSFGLLLKTHPFQQYSVKQTNCAIMGRYISWHWQWHTCTHSYVVTGWVLGLLKPSARGGHALPSWPTTQINNCCMCNTWSSLPECLKTLLTQDLPRAVHQPWVGGLAPASNHLQSCLDDIGWGGQRCGRSTWQSTQMQNKFFIRYRIRWQLCTWFNDISDTILLSAVLREKYCIWKWLAETSKASTCKKIYKFLF